MLGWSEHAERAQQRSQRTADPVGRVLWPRSILVVIDGSRASHLALRLAARIARRSTASLAAIHFVSSPDPVAFDLPWVGLRSWAHVRSAGEDVLAEARRIVGDVLTKAELDSGDLADGIRQVVIEREVDLIVVAGSITGRRLFAPDLAATTAKLSPCSVLVVRRRQRERRHGRTVPAANLKGTG